MCCEEIKHLKTIFNSLHFSIQSNLVKMSQCPGHTAPQNEKKINIQADEAYFLYCEFFVAIMHNFLKGYQYMYFTLLFYPS